MTTMRKLFSAVASIAVLVHGFLSAPAQTPSARPAQTLSAKSAQTPSDVERRVESMLKQMTLEEKIDMLGGVDGFFIRDVPRLGLPRLKMADGPLGVRNFGPATASRSRPPGTRSWPSASAQRLAATRAQRESTFSWGRA